MTGATNPTPLELPSKLTERSRTILDRRGQILEAPYGGRESSTPAGGDVHAQPTSTRWYVRESSNLIKIGRLGPA